MHLLFKKNLWTRELFCWYLYDFANSFIYINSTLYFSQWVVVDGGFTDFWYSVPFIIATIVLIFTSSYVGNHGDRTGKHFQIFFGASLLAMVSMFLLFLTGKFLPSGANVIVALVFFGIYQIGYLLAFVPYNAFLKHIAEPEQYGAVSGIGLGFSQLGSITGLLLTLPIIKGSLTIFGTDRLAPILPALIAFIFFAVPSFLVFRRKIFKKKIDVNPTVVWWKSFWTNLIESRKYPGVFPLLLSFYFFSDAIITLSLYSAIYLENVFGAPDTVKVTMALLTLGGFALGAFISGMILDRAGHRRVLLATLFFSALSIISIALTSNGSLLYLLFAVFGLGAGGVYSASRSLMASLIPKEESGKYFGLYTFAERFASIVGPFVWGLIIWIFAGIHPVNYRISAFVMGTIVFLGIIPIIWRARKNI